MPSSAVQLSVPVNPTVGFPGLEYDDDYSDIVTWIATVAIPFGALVYESLEGKAALPTATGNVTAGRVGVALIDHNKQSGQGYQVGDPVRVMRRGRVWVLSELAVAFTDTLFVRFAAGGGGSQLGAFRNSADTAAASTPVNIALLRAGAANALAVSIGDIS